VSYSHGSWDETVNEVRLSYTDRANNYTERPALFQDFANAGLQGGAVAQTVDIKGISQSSVANVVVNREGRVASIPLAKLSIKVNRDGVTAAPGSVFKWVGTPFGVASMVFRVIDVDLGDYTGNTITINAVQDVFSLARPLTRIRKARLGLIR
jgi:hypothetical protein